MSKTLGIIEVKGIASAFKVLDGMLKSSDVKYCGSEKSLGSGLVSVIIEGETSSVYNAIDVGKIIAQNNESRVDEIIIPNPHPALIKLIKEKRVNHREYKKYCIGSIEIFGYAGFIAAADGALKAGKVSLSKFGVSKGESGTLGLIVILRIYGSIEDVKFAVLEGVKQAKKVAEVISYDINTGLDSQVFAKYIL